MTVRRDFSLLTVYTMSLFEALSETIGEGSEWTSTRSSPILAAIECFQEKQPRGEEWSYRSSGFSVIVSRSLNRCSAMASKPSFFERVWAVVARVPPGRVTTYGDIAEHFGRRGAARTVGWALNGAVGSDLPCHRVVNRNGVLTGKRHFETPRVMEERLRSEGVTFEESNRVALDEHRWTPDSTRA